MLITYILQVTLCLACFYAFYHYVLHQETLFQTNRIYLLATLLMSLVLPLVRIYVETRQHPALVITVPYGYVGSYLDGMSDAITVAPKDLGFPWLNIFQLIYVMGVLVTGIHFTNEIRSILAIKSKGKIALISGHECILSADVNSPFSFFNTIYLPAGHQFNETELNEIIAHEKEHVQSRHTLDILFMELVCIGLWLSPMVYLYRKKLREIHEFLADAEVLKNTPWENYASFLLAQKSIGLQHRLSNQMFYSQLKNRLIMMNKQRSFQSSRYKYLGLLPILLLALLVFSFREKSNEETNPATNPDIVNYYSKDTLPATVISSYRVPESKSEADHATENKGALDIYETMAVFPGCEDVPMKDRGMCGQENMIRFISDHLVYPESVKKAGIEGKVIIRFTVGIDGYINHVGIEKSLHPDADKAAVEVINRMNTEAGRWIPARKEGKTMEAELLLPISFTLAKKTPEPVKPEEAYTYVEEMPRFPGCEQSAEAEKYTCSWQAMFKYVYESIKYPKEDREKGNEGQVIVQFIVKDDGSIANAKVVKGVSPGLNAEALRVVNGMNDLPQKWVPGRHEGKAVQVTFTLPLKFVLQADLSKEGKQNEVNPLRSETLKKDEEIHLYPNPTNVSINVDVFEGAHTINIYDVAGRLRLTHKIPTGNSDARQNINISTLSEGQYVLQVISDDKSTTMNFGVTR